jgi:purine-binding chemotaxis protein CheW
MSAGSAASRSGAHWADVAREAVARASGGRAVGAPQGWVHAQRLLVFRIDEALYALAVERVREIVRLRPITPVPRLPAAVVGVISLRGQILQVIDLRRRLGLPGAQGARRARIVVAHDGDGRVAGILVDAVDQVVAVGEEAFCDAPGAALGVVEGLFRREGRFVSIVDLDRVMDLDAGA